MILTLLSAGLFYLSFPNCFSMYGFGPCIFVFAVPLLLAIKDLPRRKRVAYCALWGVCAYGLMAQGLMSISVAGFVGFVFVLSLQALIFALILKPTGNVLIDSLYFPFAWSLSELARHLILGGFSFDISHALSFTPGMLGLYGSIGCLGMSAVIMFANGLIALAVSDRQHRLTCLFVAGAVVLTILGVGAVRNSEGVSNSRLVRVAVIQANISPLQKMDLDLFDRNVLLHLHLTQEAFHQGHPDLYIWPETAYPDDLWQSDQWRPVVADQARRMNADILLGDAPIIDGEEYNSALLIGSKGQMAGLYHKQALVPFAETTPFEAWGWRLGRGYHFRAGDKPGILSLKDGIRFGVVICSESAHPSMVRDLKKSNVRFLVELSNDGWFKDKASCMLHAQAAVMRAVENHLWVIRAANTGASFAVDPSGRIHSRANLKLGREGFGIFDIMIGDIKWADTRSAPTDKFEGRLD